MKFEILFNGNHYKFIDQERMIGKGDENNKDREISLRKSPENQKFTKQLQESKQEEGMEVT